MDEKITIPKLALSIEEAAKALGICKTKAYQMVATGELPSVGIGKKRLVPVDLLHRYLQTCTVRAKDESLRRD